MIPDTGLQGAIVLVGRVMPASNATFLGRIDGVEVVYKPVRGERPLWDFPDGTLAAREVATYAVSESLGWGLVPETVLGDGPHGPGMVQRWVDTDPDTAPVDVVPAGEVPQGHLHVLDAFGPDDEPVSLVHEDSAALRRMAVLDVLVNNGDRKGGHVLALRDGRRMGVDHGVSFHVEHKLRTVLWGWAGRPLLPEEGDAVARAAADEDLELRLRALLAGAEVDAFRARCRLLLDRGTLPLPGGDWPSIPWPAF